MAAKDKTKSADTKPYENPYFRKPKGKINLWRMIYHKDKNYYFGRTPKSWGQLAIFYACWYIYIAVLFSICIQGLLATLDMNQPKYVLESSRIGTNPGLGFRPISSSLSRGSLIWYNARKAEDINQWVQLVDEFLEPYTNSSKLVNGGQNHVHCDFERYPNDQQACTVDISNWGNCTAANSYGFNRSAPCIILKLNRIYKWEPEYYDNVNELPSDMPLDLQNYIKSLPEKQRKQVWVSCEGENPSDKEIIGPIKYYQRGFPGYFYPYMNVPGYMSPLVVIQLERPQLHRIINVECRAWAKNIHFNGSVRDRQGSIHIEVMIDD